MKQKLRVVALMMAAVAVMLASTQCNKSDKGNNNNANNNTQQAAKPVARVTDGPLPNIRYVDQDSLLKGYNLSKDYNEEMLRMQSNLENTMRQRESAINSALMQMQQKLQNNGYQSEQQYNADQQNVARMQNNAQNELAKMQNDMEKSLLNGQQTVQDSIDSFIKDYNASHGYDAIIYKQATMYINPDLDITNEVIEGLNARYNKVNK